MISLNVSVDMCVKQRDCLSPKYQCYHTANKEMNTYKAKVMSRSQISRIDQEQFKEQLLRPKTLRPALSCSA